VTSGSAGLEPAVRAELLTILSSDADAPVAERARNALLSVTPDVLLEAAKMPDAMPALFAYVAEAIADHAAAASVLAANPQCPPKVLAPLAGHLPPAAVQSLIDDLDRISSSPELVAVLVALPTLAVEQKKTLEELSKESDKEAIAKSLEEAELEPHKRVTLLQRLSSMRVVERIQMALKGSREERMVLIRDPNKLVQRGVLGSPRLTTQEVEAFAGMGSVSEDVLRGIAVNRAFMKNYAVVRGLSNNPKSPLDISLHLLPRLTATDLKRLSTNKNVPETLRSAATKLVRQKTIQKSGSE
jgi:hypothetical protein